jgi:hypothetical protein
LPPDYPFGGNLLVRVRLTFIRVVALCGFLALRRPIAASICYDKFSDFLYL